MKKITVTTLFKNQAHLGHLKQFRHPKMKSFIYKTIHQQDIINLEYTIKQFDLAKDLVSLLSNQNILLVSKNEIFFNKENITQINKWKPGFITNFHYGKLTNFPDLIVVDSVSRNAIAIKEAKKYDIPVIAICDTNAFFDSTIYNIVMNDDNKPNTQLVLENLLY